MTHFESRDLLDHFRQEAVVTEQHPVHVEFRTNSSALAAQSGRSASRVVFEQHGIVFREDTPKLSELFHS